MMYQCKVHTSKFSLGSVIRFMSLVVFLFTLPQMSISQSDNDRDLKKIQDENIARILEDMQNQKTKALPRSILTDKTWGPNQRSKKSSFNFPGMVIFFIIGYLILFITIIATQIKKKKEKEKQARNIQSVLTLKEQQLTEMFEKKNLEKIVEEGLATTIIKVRCRSCNSLNEEGNKFCGECGKKL